MSRVRDIANILSGGSSAIATDAEIPSYVAGKNFVINGGMDIWQRGTSFTTDSGATVLYTADRISAWTLYPGNGSTQTITRETSSSHIPPNFKYSLKSVVSNAIPVNSGRMVLGYTMENQDALFLAGKTITYSMQVKAIGNIDRVYLYSRYNTTGGNSHNNGTDAANAFFTINSSSFTTITWTTTVPSATTITSSGTYGLQFVYYRSNNAVEAIGDGIYVTGIQAEIGSVATPFSRAGGTIQGELAACQRYFERMAATSIDSTFGTGVAYLSTAPIIHVQWQVPKRIAPSISFAGTWEVVGGNSVIGVTSPNIGANSTTVFACQVGGTASGLTQGQAQLLRAGIDAPYIDISAEL